MLSDGLHSGADHDQLEHIVVHHTNETALIIVIITAVLLTIVGLAYVAKAEKEDANSRKDR